MKLTPEEKKMKKPREKLEANKAMLNAKISELQKGLRNYEQDYVQDIKELASYYATCEFIHGAWVVVTDEGRILQSYARFWSEPLALQYLKENPIITLMAIDAKPESSSEVLKNIDSIGDRELFELWDEYDFVVKI